MITSKTLLITILWFFAFGEHSINVPTDCESFKVTHALSAKGQSQNLDLTISGGKSPYKIILSKNSGELVTENFDQTHFESLASGGYTCVVVDHQNCKRKFEITVP